MAPIRKGDGTVLNPKGFAEVRKGAGTVLYSAGSAIPDSVDLHAHYDASDKTDVSSAWTAEVGPDLSAVGSPSIKTSEKNGLNVASYDGSDDGHTVTWSSTQSMPGHYFVVFRFVARDGYLFGGVSSGNRWDFQDDQSNSSWAMKVDGDTIRGGSPTTDWYVGSMLFDSSNSEFRLNGSSVMTGTLNDGSDGLSLGWLDWNSGSYAEVDIGEFLYYPMDKSGIQSDVEQYLSDKWNITT